MEPGRNYFVLLTTASGLYRYDIHDLVRCTGHLGQAPILEFLSKGSQFSNVTGEKLSEYQVVAAVEKAARELQMGLSCFTVAPCWGSPPYYVLLAEESEVSAPRASSALAARVDALLATGNVEYRSKRNTRRLAPLKVRLVPTGTWQRWQREKLSRTFAAAEQYKHPYLISSFDFADQFPNVVEASDAVA